MLQLFKLYYYTANPPVTPKLNPMIFFALSEAKKDTASPMSSGVCPLFNGTFSWTWGKVSFS
jgi:hypothetical protein